MPSNNWYVITGGPSTGKTTLLKKLNNLGYKVVPEAARTVIDNALSQGISVEELRADEADFQDKVIELKAKIEKELDKNVITFLDRGMHDTLAYNRYYDFKIKDWHEELLKTSKYKQVFLLDPLPRYDKDYARVEGEDFKKRIQVLLDEAYAEFGMSPIHVPAVSIEDRLKLIIDHVTSENN